MSWLRNSFSCHEVADIRCLQQQNVIFHYFHNLPLSQNLDPRLKPHCFVIYFRFVLMYVWLGSLPHIRHLPLPGIFYLPGDDDNRYKDKWLIRKCRIRKNSVKFAILQCGKQCRQDLPDLLSRSSEQFEPSSMSSSIPECIADLPDRSNCPLTNPSLPALITVNDKHNNENNNKNFVRP